MPNNHQAITDLLHAKSEFENQVNAGATGTTLSNLMAAIYTIQQGVGQLVLQGLAANYTPPTKDFLAVTAQAQSFIKELNAIKNAFSTIGSVVNAVASVLPYVV